MVHRGVGLEVTAGGGGDGGWSNILVLEVVEPVDVWVSVSSRIRVES